MVEFKVGDRVITAKGIFASLHVDWPGVVVYASGDRIGVEFDCEIPGGHDCRGRGKFGHCRFGSSKELELYYDTSDAELPKEFFYKSRKLSRFLSEFKAASEGCCN